ncbi:MAG: GGDEF domain-containing protein [Lachnospiraceae bacterium]|nr:GGDEF domain-containing protein [Lachnospiraceae bacterium]
MRKQVVQGFHDFKGKIYRIFGQNGEREQQKEISRTEAADLGNQDMHGTGQDAFDKLVERRVFERIVDEELRAGHSQGCLLVGNVDRFREVCEIYGQDTGNAVLRRVVEVLSYSFAESVCMSRQGRDTFAMWLPGVAVAHTTLLYRRAGEVNDVLLHPDGEFPPVTLSIGMAFGDSVEDCRELGKRAVKALNHVKESGRCGCEIYDGHGR